LEKGVAVRILDNLTSGYMQNVAELKGASFIRGDIRDKGVVDREMKGVDTVFHLAASVGNVRSIENSILDSDVNVLGTLQILESAVRNGVEKVVYCSSAAIFGEPQQLPVDERHRFAPDSPYGVSKLAGELQALCMAKLHKISVVCLRYFNVYGRNQRFDAYGNVIPIFASRMLKNEPVIIFGKGDQTRDFVNVKDVARANLLAAENRSVTGVFNIGSGVSETINGLAGMLQKIIGGSSEVRHAEARKGEVLHSRADITLARQQLGYEPEVKLKDGLIDYVAWMREDQKSSLKAAL
jgi:UDP-glucose 4-epimerase